MTALLVKRRYKMGLIKLMTGKLHRVRVTKSDKNYIGSITIDSELMNKADIIPLQEIEVVNISNGNRWSTYALPGNPSSGEICPNGGGALLCSQGDILIIFSYIYMNQDELKNNGHKARTLVFDDNNVCVSVIEQNLSDNNGRLIYESNEVSLSK
jgi:aspartate 1-decarboxylase